MTNEELFAALKNEFSTRFDALEKSNAALVESNKEICTRLDALEESNAALVESNKEICVRLDALEESNEEVRDSVNVLLKWADDVGTVIKVPLGT